MSRNGSGVYSAPASSWSPAVSGALASYTDWNSLLADISAALTQSLSADGQTPASGNLNMNGNKLTNLAAPTSNGDAVRFNEFSVLVGFKNRLINAQGLINQRGYVSGTATTTGNQYTVDRWRVVVSGQNLTFTTTNNVTTFTAPAGGVEQVIEGLNLESGTYVLSWTGNATAKVAGVTVTNGGTVTVVGGTNTTVQFAGGTFSLPQFEKGSTITAFDYRPYSNELALCQRYFYKVGEFGSNGQVLGLGWTRTNEFDMTITLPVTMRATPTIFQTTGANYYYFGGAINRLFNSFSALEFFSGNTVNLYVTGPTGLTAGQSSQITTYTAGAYLGLSSEI